MSTVVETRRDRLNRYIVLDAVDLVFAGPGELGFGDLLKPFGLDEDDEDIAYRSAPLLQELWPNNRVMGAPDNALGYEAMLAGVRVCLLTAALLERIVERGSEAARLNRENAAEMLARMQDAEEVDGDA